MPIREHVKTDEPAVKPHDSCEHDTANKIKKDIAQAIQDKSKKQTSPKKKKMSNFEKGISLMCKTLNETSEKEFERYKIV